MEELLQRSGTRNSYGWPDRYAVRSILIIVDNIDDHLIGDTIVRLSKLKFIDHYFANARMTINTASRIWYDLALHSPYIDKVTNDPTENIDYDGYDLVILVVDDKKKYVSSIASCVQCSGKRNIAVVSIYDAKTRVAEEVKVPFLKEVIEFPYPGSLVDDVDKCEVYLTQQELAQATETLDRVDEQQLIIYFDKASEYRKMLPMSVNTELIKYFQSMKGRKLILFDPFNENKAEFYRSLHVDTSNVFFISGLSVRQTMAIMADRRVEFIMGPCTGLMHAASAVYNFLIKNKLRSRAPFMTVYTGLYTGNLTNAGVWWKGRLVDCMIIRKVNDEVRIVRLEDMSPSQISVQENVLPCKDYTFDLIKEHLQLNYNLPEY